MRKGLVAMLALVIVVLPSVTANGNVPGIEVSEDYTRGVVRYHLDSESYDLDNPTAGEVVNLTYNATKLHNFNTVQHRLILSIEVTAYYVPTNTGTWNIIWTQDGQGLEDCESEIIIIDPGVLGGEPAQTVTNTLHCERLGSVALNNLLHNHTLAGNLSIVSGNPPDLDHLDISLIIEREDLYLIPQDQNELIEFTTAQFPTLAFIAFAIWAWTSRAPMVYLATAAIGITAAVASFATFGVLGPTVFVMALVALIGDFTSELTGGGSRGQAD